MSVCLVTGGSGFVGSCLIHRLISNGEHVRALVRSNSNPYNLKNLDIEKRQIQYTNIEQLKEEVKDVDYIYHSAGAIKSATQAKGYYLGNVLPTKNLLKAASESAHNLKRFVHVSSLSAAGPAKDLNNPPSEETPSQPISLYGKSKFESEKIAKTFMNKIPITILRPAVVFGERDLEMLKSFQSIAKGISPILEGKNKKFLSFIYVQDLIDGMLLAAESEKAIGQTYFLADQKPYSYREFCEIIQKKLNKKNVINIPLPDFIPFIIGFFSEVIMKITRKPIILSFDKAREMKQDYWVCSVEKAKKELGFSAKTPLDEAVVKTISWAKSKKLL